jgi:cytoskeletal protein CcmA (bactofilin family)
MDNTRNHDLRINGNGSAAGGTYRNISINGNGSLNGDIECADIKVNGLGDIAGSIVTKTGNTNGKMTVDGSLAADVFGINGLVEVGRDMNVKAIRTLGQLAVEGKITSENLENRGMLKVNGDCAAETFYSEGVFNIKGLLNSGTVDITLHSTCYAKEIGGDRINIRKGAAYEFKKFIKSLFPSFEMNFGLSTDSIEGDDIYIEYTIAKVVRGTNVNIGPGCEIGLVEYKNQYTLAGDSKVESAVKV